MLNQRWLLFVLISAIFSFSTAYADSNSAFIDSNRPAEFIVKNFDLRSVRSSFGPKRISGKSNYFSDFKMIPTTLEKNRAVFDQDDWVYQINVLGIKDYNDDGVMDYAVCFIDKAKIGNYDSEQQLVLTRYNHDMPLIAISYDYYQDDGC